MMRRALLPPLLFLAACAPGWPPGYAEAFTECRALAAQRFDPDDPQQAAGRYDVIGECLARRGYAILGRP